MKLIDADALIDMLGVSDTDIEIRELLSNAPTVDAVPVRKGKWIRTGRTNIYCGIELQCPFCNDRVMVSRVDHEIYCRHCGAKLREEECG